MKRAVYVHNNVPPWKEKMIRKSKKAQKRNRAKKELDAAARLEVFERDGYKCVRCGSDKIQWAHIIGRRHLCTRWLPENALTLCAGCHMFWHEYPTLSGDWFRKNWPERAEYIHTVYDHGEKVSPVARLEELRASK